MSITIRTDVTAVKLVKNRVFAGVGCFAHVYSLNSFKFLCKVKCLCGQKIYGFVPSAKGDKIIVFGGKQYAVIYLRETTEDEGDIEVTKLVGPIMCIDWLHSTIWIDNEMIAVLTAHNTTQIWNINNQQMEQQYLSNENSILYSGLLLLLRDGLLVFAGTVFSEVIMHTPKHDKALHYLKGHRGVIFSISASLEKGVIVTTSDDRSVRIWTANHASSEFASNTTDYWCNVSINCKHEIYGHSARVMRSCITDNYVVSVGEDSALCFWDYKGNLVKKTVSHQNSCIWSVDADSTNIVTGGGDGAVVLHPLTTAIDYDNIETYNVDSTPKKIAFTARRNLVILDDSDNLIHYNILDKRQTTHRLNHKSTYKLISLSMCKQLIAVADMFGKFNIFAESCKDEAFLVKLIETDLNIGKLLSMHWAGNRHLVICSQDGIITLLSSYNGSIEKIAVFILPQSKERWLTSAALHLTNKTLVVGDRCSNIHVYYVGNKNPVKSFNKVHGRYGPTSITLKGNVFITTGCDGTIKYFTLNEGEPKLRSCKDLEFQWVEKFIDRDQHVVCGFQERYFVLYNIKTYSKLLEVQCGGGHRSWDVLRYIDKVNSNYEEFIQLVYVKNREIHSHTFQMNKIVSRNIINSSHSKEINCLKTFSSNLDDSITFLITGGEDTTLRISSIDMQQRFVDKAVFKNLSNVRTLKYIDNNGEILVISAGGRAQICIKSIKVFLENGVLDISSEDLVDYLVKGTDKQRKNNQTWRESTVDFDPETRIMDLDVMKLYDSIIIFAGCSDAYLRVFTFVNKTLSLVDELLYHKTCILKTMCVTFLKKTILITTTTRGEITFWDVTDPLKKITPFFTATSNKSGINSIDTKILSESLLLVATGGDDNALHLLLIEMAVQDINSASVKSTWLTDKYHCSQITGLRFMDNYLLSTSIDQRITLSEWCVEDNVTCEFKSQSYTDVADIQGLEILKRRGDTINVCVFGKGFEVVAIPLACHL